VVRGAVRTATPPSSSRRKANNSIKCLFETSEVRTFGNHSTIEVTVLALKGRARPPPTPRERYASARNTSQPAAALTGFRS
jgi:hypothetical protein